MRYRKNYLCYKKEIMPSWALWMQYIEKKKKKENKNRFFSIIQKIRFDIKHSITERHNEKHFIKNFFYKIKENKKKILDKWMYFVALIWPVMTLPQTITIFQTQDASNISRVTWITYVITASLWLSYWISHKEKPIIFSNIMRLLAHWSVLLWIIIYK